MCPVTLKGRYRVHGPGVASGEVVSYAAENVARQQPVALTVLRGDVASDAEFVAAVREQAYRLAKPVCQHRTLVRVYDTGTTDEGEPFVALEPVVGRSLRELLDERGVFPAHDGLRIAIQVGEGLETLHRSGIVHGELRPESVLIIKDEDGTEAVKLVGVELTAARRTPVGLRRRNELVGAYLAPEQIAQAETSEASDVHGLGLLILELLTGQRPGSKGHRTPAEIPAAIARIVAKAIEPGPGRRYSSISLMVNDLWTAESEPPKSPARATGSPAVAARRSSGTRRAPSDVGMATALVAGLLLVGVTAWVARADRFARTAPSTSPEAVVAASPVTPVQDPASPAPVPEARTSPPAAEPMSITLPPAVSPTAATVPAPAEPRPSPTESQAIRPASPPPLEERNRAMVGAVRAPRPAVQLPERAAKGDQPAADGGDGTAIIDWLLKDERSGG